MADVIDIVSYRHDGKRVERITVEHSKALGSLMHMAYDHLRFMSKESMKEWLVQACDLLEETLPWGKTAKIKSKITLIRKYLDRRYEKMTREYLISYITNIILTAEGLGNLSGFGYGVKGSTYTINPEYISIREK